MYDIHDGQLWSEFKDKNGHVFTEQERSLLFTLNVDWFQSSKQSVYSVGAVYLSINNLPRHLRYKKENIILVCLTPGPKEPDTSQIHKYLQVMVDELNELYYGEFYKCTFKSPTVPVQIRAALFLVACDMPASRKVSGFTSFNATVPCNKCSSDFPGRKDIKTHRDFVPSLSSYSTWVLRINETNRQQASNWKTATNQRERIDLEMKFGTRFSALHNLAYFDVVRCTSVDPMHNLFLGTAKKMVHIWRTTKNKATKAFYLSDNDLDEMQATSFQT
ncbi:hypothetical protein G6F56_012965 [Rhizopus delemar]|nr:hypothetical protein G6F56_012965 [Rhizopus delemar]